MNADSRFLLHMTILLFVGVAMMFCDAATSSVTTIVPVTVPNVSTSEFDDPNAFLVDPVQLEQPEQPTELPWSGYMVCWTSLPAKCRSVP